MAAKWDKIMAGRDTENAAHVLTNRYTLSSTLKLMPNSFMLTHSHFASANIVLQRNVHLWQIGRDVVKFIQVDEGVDLYDTLKYPILHLAQLQNAKCIIYLPRTIFDTLASNIDIEKRDIAWLFMTPRCGSTLWGQIFAVLPNWSVINESLVLYNSTVFEYEIDDVITLTKTQTFEGLVEAYVKWHTLAIPEDHSIFWKGTILDHHIIPILREKFPHIKILFGYRDILPSAKSWQKSFGSLPGAEFGNRYIFSPVMATGCPRNIPEKDCFVFFTNGYNIKTCIEAFKASNGVSAAFEQYMFIWAAIIAMMKQYKHDGYKILPMKYEDLIADRRQTIGRVFDYLDIPAKLIDLSLTAMDRDSQEGLFFDKKTRSKNPSWVRTEDAVRRCNAILKVFDVGDLDSTTTF